MHRRNSSQNYFGPSSGHINRPTNHYFARLMTPAEVTVATRHRPPKVRHKTEGHWVLCGDVSTTTFKEMQNAQAARLPPRLTAFISPAGFAYGVFTHQVGRHQHRFLLALNDPSVRAFFESIANTGKMMFMLGEDEGEDALLFENELIPTVLLPMLAMTPEANLETQKIAMRELAFVQTAMGDLLQVPSLYEGYVVQHVSVSLLMPNMVLEWVQNEIFRKSGV